ncbi:MAG: alpha-hydroxy acid oxidase [Rhizobiaceae bacterium]
MSVAIPADIVSLGDYERHAEQRLPADRWAYLAGGAADGLTRRWNREAFDRLRLAGRVLRDMTGANTRTTLFGREMAAPLVVAPTAFQTLFHADGELGTVLGAGATGTWMTVSTQAGVSLEEVAAARHAPLWFQLYMQHRRADTLNLVRRAEAAGYEALVVTVDAPVNGARNEESRAGFRLPAGVEAVNTRGMAVPSSTAGPGESPVFKGLLDGAPAWRDIEWLRAETRLPVLLKGIMHAGDARLAVETGMDGVVVSNHGGRTLDTLPATIEALPSVAEAAGDRIAVLLDGGVRRGTDVLKALALGAKAVMVGRPVVHGLAVAGAVGVAHVIGILRAELETAMALAGCPTVDAIGESAIWSR